MEFVHICTVIQRLTTRHRKKIIYFMLQSILLMYILINTLPRYEYHFGFIQVMKIINSQSWSKPTTCLKLLPPLFKVIKLFLKPLSHIVSFCLFSWSQIRGNDIYIANKLCSKSVNSWFGIVSSTWEKLIWPPIGMLN